MGSRVLVLSASIGSGHVMAAAALVTAFAARSDVDEVASIDALQGSSEVFRAFYDDAYFALVKATPWLVGWGYDANDVPFKLGSSVSLWDRINTSALVREILDFAPTVVVCTHFLPLRLVALLLARGSISCSLSAVTTDYDFQGLWLTGVFTRYFVAREETKDYLVAMGLPEERVTVSGIPVRPELGQPVDRGAVLGRYGLTADVPTLLISAGAAGGAYVTSIVNQVKRLRSPVQAVIVCGRSEALRARISAQVEGLDHLVVLGYTDDMTDLMRSATLFVGKPGGLSSSECMAAGLPMVLVSPIPGQEVRNSDFLL
ncbi:MAG: putative glycosyltransferase, partial [Spirosoma sp.]|nr:putative glycosyltransferase [Spirosoma sp.]